MQQYSDDMQNGPATRPVKRTRKTHAEPTQTSRNGRIQTRALTSFQQQNNLTYNARTELPAHYSITDQRNMVNHSNQVLYPNMMHVPTTAPYSMPQQLAQPPTNSTTMNAQPVESRYNTRGVVHNLPIVSAPTMSRYWNTPRPPVSQQRQRVQQMNTPAPVERPLPKQTKDESAQTEFSIAEGEVKLLKSLRSRRMDVSKLNIILEKGDYIVTYDEKPPEKDGEKEERDENGNKIPIERDTYNKILGYSNFGKGQIFSYVAYSFEMQRRTAMEALAMSQNILNSRRAIQYQTSINHASANQVTPPVFLQNEQQQKETANIPQRYPDKNMQENMCTNDETVNPRTGTQQRVPQQIPETPPRTHESFPIPTINNFYNNFHSRRHANSQGGAPYPRVPNIPINLLQAAAVYLNNDFNHGMSNYFTNPNFCQPPWGA